MRMSIALAVVPHVERGVAIVDEVLWRLVPRERLATLLGGPRGGWTVGDAHMDDTAALMGQNHQHEQQAIGRGWYDEEVRPAICPM